MGLLCFIYLICALRTNLVFVGIFATLCAGFGCLAGVYWYGAEADAETAEALTVAAGALTFVSDMLGWWIFFAILLASLDFPFQLPGKSSNLFPTLLGYTDYVQSGIYHASSRERATRPRRRKRFRSVPQLTMLLDKDVW